MMRLFLATTFLAAPAWAEDFLTPAPVTDVTIYPVGANVGRSLSVELPAGRHRILIPNVQSHNGAPRITLSDGATLGAVQMLPSYLTDAEAILTDPQRTAAAAVKAAEDVFQSRQDAVVRKQADVEGQAQKLAYLRSLSGANLTTTDPDAFSAASDVVASQIANAALAKLQAEKALRNAVEARGEAQTVLAQAQSDLARLSPPQGSVDVLAIAVETAAAGPVEVVVDTLTAAAGWQADYDLNLTRGDAARIDMKRKVVLRQNTAEAWTDAALIISTANPFAQVEPSVVFPSEAQIQRKGKSGLGSTSGVSRSQIESDRALESPAMEPAVVSAEAVIDGLSVTYDYPYPVSVTAGAQAVLSLDDFSFDARAFKRAAPRFDQTAFLMAEFTNNTQEPFLPGQASISRDGVFIGRAPLQHIPAGAKAEVSFGSLEGLRLDYTLLDNDTGESGFLTTSSTRTQEMEFSVENLLNTSETVQTIFALPYAEQEDLTINVRALPRPDETDFEKRRNVSVWSIELGPGEKKTVRVTIKMDWPDGERLFWQP